MSMEAVLAASDDFANARSFIRKYIEDCARTEDTARANGLEMSSKFHAECAPGVCRRWTGCRTGQWPPLPPQW